MRHDRDPHRIQRCEHLAAEERRVPRVVRVRDESDARGEQLRSGGLDLDRTLASGPREGDPVVGTRPFAVHQLGLRHRRPKVDVPEGGRGVLDQLAPEGHPEEAALGDPLRLRGDRRVGMGPVDREPERAPEVLEDLFVFLGQALAELDEVGARDRKRLLRRLRRRHEVRVVGEPGIAADAVVVLDPALGRQAVVVPTHRIEDRLAAHPVVTSDRVGVGVGEHVPDVERAGHRRGRRVDRVHLRAGRRAVERIGAVALPPLRPRRLEALEPGLLGDTRRRARPDPSTVHFVPHDRVTVPCVLELHDTATGRVAPLELRSPGKVAMYVCGPTVYDAPHLGHGRFALVFDVLRRYLIFNGLDVTYVSNVTDIDDKIIERAAASGLTEPELAAKYEEVWWQAMDALGVLRPDETPHATAYVDRMIGLIGQLVERGIAYQTSDGVYLSVSEVPGYGLLAHQPLESLRAGARVEVDEEKRSPLDFVLWKKARPGEPTWDSPWGPGRPGWHTECVVMSLDLLGDGFDLHGGGIDLIFPHHENERAQAVASGHGFARHWVHNGWVTVGGEKMSKSLGNFTTLDDLLARSDARAYRLLVLRSHYRSPIEISPKTVRDAEAGLARLDEMALRFGVADPLAAGPVIGEPAAGIETRRGCAGAVPCTHGR